ncbi:MAG: radical SAM protein [Candidatus Sumerlaeota bacterium]|nr:radical SAM protein [Candidatus Sumerlaeota bacterium]
MGSYETRKRISRLLADERGGNRKPFGSGHALGIIYPNEYRIGMSNLGHQIIYSIVNSDPGWSCERFYTDFDPPLSMENQQAPCGFNILAFSIAYELDYLNALDFLERAGIPLRASDRASACPLIVAAGVCISVNRHPIYEFADVCLHGEGEELVKTLMRAYDEHSGGRRRLLESLAEKSGFEITAGARKSFGMDMPDIAGGRLPFVERVFVKRIEDHRCCSVIVTPHTEFASMCLVEIARGCPYNCAFCFVGHNLNPCRFVSARHVKEWISGSLALTNRFGLIASAIGSHPEIDEICSYCDEQGVHVSCSSLRAEDVTPAMLGTLARGGAQTLTIAPEAGSPRLRRLLGKARLPDERIDWVVEQAVKAGIPSLKMYFMAGLPTETEEDIGAIAQLVRRVQKVFVSVSRPQGRIGSLMINVGIFVPKPGTPLGKYAIMPGGQLKRRLALLKKQLGSIGSLRYQPPSLMHAQAQAILASGDLRAAGFLLAALKGGWRSALRECPLFTNAFREML